MTGERELMKDILERWVCFLALSSSLAAFDCHEVERLCSTTLFYDILSHLTPKAIELENNGLNLLKP